jgi:hypothetical protein
MKGERFDYAIFPPTIYLAALFSISKLITLREVA